MQNNNIDDLRFIHRRRRFAMKLQQKVERALESHIRRNATDWAPDMTEEERKQRNLEVKRLIVAARKNECDKPWIIEDVSAADKARLPADEIRERTENDMRRMASELPVYAWTESVRGAGALGLATIVAEAGDLAHYANPAKLWKRLGFAPYDGFAGSTWKRDSWRPRALTAEEWVANPFSGERYALMNQIAEALVLKSQWIGAAKTGTDEGKPNGPYGEVYARRRAHTKVTHPDWTKQHSKMDGLRVAMKAFLLDLWCVWNGKTAKHFRSDQAYDDAHEMVVAPAAAGHVIDDAQRDDARRGKKSPGQRKDDAHYLLAGSGADGQSTGVTQQLSAVRATKSKLVGRKTRGNGKKSPGLDTDDAHRTVAGSGADGHAASDAHTTTAVRATKSAGRKKRGQVGMRGDMGL